MTTPNIDSTYLARDVLCVAVVGDIDIASADSLSEALGAALGVGGITRVMVDMQRTTFLDSAGVRPDRRHATPAQGRSHLIFSPFHISCFFVPRFLHVS